MGKMILCRGKQTDNPLVIEGTGVRLYTAEELCYYIYNNIYLIGQDLIDDRLIEFLAQTGEGELSERVRALHEKRAGLAEIIVTILKSVDYYSVSDIEKIREILNTLGRKNVCERLKLRGDSFLSNDCFFSAVRCYESIIHEYKGNGLSGADYAKVYHNLGTAYARMFLYKKAARYYDEAYRMGQHEESLKSSIAAKMMAEKNSGPVNVDASDEECVISREIETLMDNARYCEEYRQIETLDELKQQGQIQEFNSEIDSMLEKWKKDYLKYSKII